MWTQDEVHQQVDGASRSWQNAALNPEVQGSRAWGFRVQSFTVQTLGLLDFGTLGLLEFRALGW